jgi:hypothetical protein
MTDMEERFEIWTFDCFEGSLQTQSGLKGDLGGQTLLVASLSEGAGKPLQPFIKTISRGSAGGLDVLSRN